MDNIAIRCSNYEKKTVLLVKNNNYKDMVTRFALNSVLHHVDLSLIIETNQKLEYDIDKNIPYWITDGTWHKKSICIKLNGTVSKKYIRNARTDIYNIMCYIYAHDKQQPSSVDDVSSGGGNTLPSNSTTEALA